MGLKMFKKIIFLTYILSNTNVFSMQNVKELSTQESSIYNKIMNQYQPSEQITHSQVEQLLQSENISIQQLYNIVERQNDILKRKLYTLQSQRRDQGLELLISMGSVIIGAPLLSIGLGIKNYVAPSTIQKVASYGLITMGGIALLPEISLEVSNSGLIAQGLRTIYDIITQKDKKVRNISIETEIISGLMAKLKKLYPELITWEQPTYQ
jgi:hypothetical protein